MKKVLLVSMVAVAASAGAADALAPIDGAAAVKVTRFTAAQAAQYRGGFTRDGEEVVCNYGEEPFGYGGKEIMPLSYALFK